MIAFFIDLRATFDTVAREVLVETMRERGGNKRRTGGKI